MFSLIPLIKMKKKVLFVTTISGFLPQFEKNDVSILKEMGFEIHYASNFKNPVYTFSENIFKDQKILLHHIDIAKNPSKAAVNLHTIRQLIKIIDENNIDLVHCHNPMGGVTARIAAAYSRKKPYVIYTAHGFHFYKGASLISWLLFYSAERFLAHYTDQIITINKEDYLRAKQFHLKKGGSIHQIHSVGVDDCRFAPHKEIAAEKRNEIGIPPEAFHIVTAAELNKNKNQKTIIYALAKLRNPNIHYSICGRGINEVFLKRLTSEKQLSDRVHFLGYRTDMEEILQTADCFAFPSYREGLGVAAIEALLCGVPLIVSDNRGTREYAQEGVNSIICNAKNADDFAAAIHKLCSNPSKREQMARLCRASAEQFTIREVEQTMRQIYQDAASNI